MTTQIEPERSLSAPATETAYGHAANLIDEVPIHPSYATYAALAESNAATAGAVQRARHARCDACGHPANSHKGDLGCTVEREDDLDCSCTHPTGVV